MDVALESRASIRTGQEPCGPVGHQIITRPECPLILDLFQLLGHVDGGVPLDHPTGESLEEVTRGHRGDVHWQEVSGVPALSRGSVDADSFVVSLGDVQDEVVVFE